MPSGRLHLHGEWQFAVPDASSSLTLGAYRRVPVTPDQVIMLPPFTVHAEGHAALVRPGWSALFIAAPVLERMGAAWAAQAWGRGDGMAVVTNADAAAALRDLVDPCGRPSRPEADYVTALTGWCAALFAHGRLVAGARVPASVGAACGFLQQHPTRSVVLGDVARAAGVGRSYLRRAFARLIGMPPLRYHGQVRLAHARQLLAGGASVASVAYACGFADQSHLSRAFRAHYALPPGAFRPSADAPCTC